MKKLSLVLAGAVIMLSSCGKSKLGPDTTKTFSVDSVHSVEIEAAIEANVFYGETQSVVLTGTETYMPKVNVTVSNGVLVIGMDKGNYRHNNIVADITLPAVDMVNLKGSGDIWVDNFTVESLSLLIDGSGDIDTEELTVADDLNLEIDGSGNIEVNGSTDEIKISVDGSGNIEAYAVDANDGDVSIDGSGNVEVNASNSLNVDIDGSGNVTYQGDPTVSSNIS
jgi:hypothetical protein